MDIRDKDTVLKNIDDKYTSIPKKIGELILNNSLFKLSGFILHRSSTKSYRENNIKRNEDIDVGISGIILFLIELSKILPEPKIRNAIQDAGEELMNNCKLISRSHYGFYKGRAGVCYTLMELSEATGDCKYQNFAMELIKNESYTFILSEFTSNRLYDGRSGLLLVLLHLYNIKAEDWIYDRISLCLEKIINDFVFTENGIVWNKRDKNIQPLNSFFYGSSGLAFVLMQVGEFFEDQELLSIAKSIFIFGDSQWNKNISNWPDYRKEIITYKDYKIHKYKYLNKNYSFFTVPSESYNLAYGTTGLCMARLPFLFKEDNTRLKSLIEKGISKLQYFKTENLSLTNGISGVGSFYLEASKYFNAPYHYERILEIANILNNKELSYQDMSLHYGTTGIGYFLLQLSYPMIFRSVLLPIVEKKILSEKNMDSKTPGNEVMLKLLHTNFPNTFMTLKIIANEHYTDLVNKKDILLVVNAVAFVNELISSLESTLSQKSYQILSDILALELAKLQLFLDTKSFSLSNIKEIVKFEDRVALMNLDEEELYKQSLVFDEDSRMVTTKWNWSRFNLNGANISNILEEFLNTDPKEIKMLLYRTNAYKIIEEKLDTFGQLTYSIFKEPQIVNNVVSEYMDAFKINNDQDRVRLRTYTRQYINYYIKKSLLHHKIC